MRLFLLFAALTLTFRPGAGQTVQITEVEVNQALGKQLNGQLNFVAGKETAIRVFLAEETTVVADQTKVVVQRDGQEVVTLAPRSYEKPVKAVEFLCPSMDACGQWAAGKYSFAATVNGVTLTTGETVYQFQARQRLRILVVPVKANYAGTITTVKDETWKQGWEFTRRTYPVAADQVKWEIKDELDGAAFDLETEDGQLGLWTALKNLVPEPCAAKPKAEGCYELVVGFISDRPRGYPNGTLQGFTYGRPANIVVASDADMQATVAHEVAHVFGAGDTYAGGSLRCKVNPSPDGVKGKDWDTSEETACTEGRQLYPDEAFSATLIPADQRPYEVGGRGALGDSACYMGNGEKMSAFWTTQDVYSQLFTQLDPVLFQEPPKSESGRAAAGYERVLHFSGSLSQGGTVRTRPWYSFETRDAIADTAGRLMLRAVDATGALLASRAFSVEYTVHSRPAFRVNEAAFDGVIRFPGNTAKFQLVRDGRVLAEMPVSGNAPQVSGVAVADSGLVTWAASDTDGDRLTYRVEYNRDAANPASPWMVLAADLDAPVWQANFEALPGSPAAAIRVLASDGIRTTIAGSREFPVPYKAPRVTLQEPLTAGGETILAGSAQDVQDGLIAGAGLVWSAEGKQLGSGSRLVLSGLEPGEHLFTLTATNSAGLSASGALRVMVE